MSRAENDGCPCMPDIRELCRKNAELSCENARLRILLAVAKGIPVFREKVDSR